jgi:hypothetical protein
VAVEQNRTKSDGVEGKCAKRLRKCHGKRESGDDIGQNM